MSSVTHLFADDHEAFEITALPRHQRIANEVRNDPVEDVLESARLPLHRSIAAIRTDAPASEVRGDRVNDLGSVSVLAEKLGRTSHPATSFARGAMETVKHPSPSTYPEI